MSFVPESERKYIPRDQDGNYISTYTAHSQSREMVIPSWSGIVVENNFPNSKTMIIENTMDVNIYHGDIDPDTGDAIVSNRTGITGKIRGVTIESGAQAVFDCAYGFKTALIADYTSASGLNATVGDGQEIPMSQSEYHHSGIAIVQILK